MKLQIFYKFILLIFIPVIIIAGMILLFRNRGGESDAVINNAAKNSHPEKAVGGIVPHHDLASDLIEDFFYRLSLTAQPETFIILGPNHADIGLSPAISGEPVWQTLSGPIENDEKILKELIDRKKISLDQENFEKEHSVRVLIPFLQRHFPDAKLLPIILTSKHDLELSMDLAEELALYIDGKSAVIISSIDFSHYLASDIAEEKDEITLDLIKNRNYQEIAGLNSDYLDSPASLIVFLRTMELLEADNMEIIEHSNSAKIIGKDLQNSTSYYTMLFTD